MRGDVSLQGERRARARTTNQTAVLTRRTQPPTRLVTGRELTNFRHGLPSGYKLVYFMRCVPVQRARNFEVTVIFLAQKQALLTEDQARTAAVNRLDLFETLSAETFALHEKQLERLHVHS